MTLEQKYYHAILVLQAIAQHKGGNKKFGHNEWTEAEAFRDCRLAAEKCLLKLGEGTVLDNNRSCK